MIPFCGGVWQCCLITNRFLLNVFNTLVKMFLLHWTSQLSAVKSVSAGQKVIFSLCELWVWVVLLNNWWAALSLCYSSGVWRQAELPASLLSRPVPVWSALLAVNGTPTLSGSVLKAGRVSVQLAAAPTGCFVLGFFPQNMNAAAEVDVTDAWFSSGLLNNLSDVSGRLRTRASWRSC